MANREALPINILVIVHQDAMAGDRVIDIQTGDIRVRESTSKNVKTYPTEIVIYVTRDRIGCISKLRAKRLGRRLTMRFVVFSSRGENECLLRHAQLGFKGGFDLA
jgi:hypothetical protein